jgi:hypothetical protein
VRRTSLAVAIFTTVPGVGAAKSLHLGASLRECEIEADLDSNGPRPVSMFSDVFVPRCCILSVEVKAITNVVIVKIRGLK